MLRRIGGNFLLLFLALVVSPIAYAQDKIDATRINFASAGCTSLQYYSPFDNTCHNTSGFTYPSAGIVHSTGSAWDATTYAHIVALFGSGSCTGYLKNDGTCSTSGGMVYPSAGIPHSTGSAWDTATYAHIVALFGGGSCSGFLKDDGTCGGTPVNGVQSSSTSITASCGQIIKATSSSAITITLQGATVPTGCGYGITRGESAGALTINPNSVTYDGVTTQLGQGETTFIWFDGTGYHSSNTLVPGAHCTLTASIPTLTLDCTSSGISNTTITTNTTAIAANTCAAGPSSPVTMPGVTTSMTFDVTATTDTSAVTGWGANGGLTFTWWPTSNAFNYKVCNQTGSSITPGASVTWNVSAK